MSKTIGNSIARIDTPIWGVRSTLWNSDQNGDMHA